MGRQKNATPTKEQAEVLRKHGFDPLRWVVVRELPNSIIVKNRENPSDFQVLEKRK